MCLLEYTGFEKKKRLNPLPSSRHTDPITKIFTLYALSHETSVKRGSPQSFFSWKMPQKK